MAHKGKSCKQAHSRMSHAMWAKLKSKKGEMKKEAFYYLTKEASSSFKKDAAIKPTALFRGSHARRYAAAFDEPQRNYSNYGVLASARRQLKDVKKPKGFIGPIQKKEVIAPPVAKGEEFETGGIAQAARDFLKGYKPGKPDNLAPRPKRNRPVLTEEGVTVRARPDKGKSEMIGGTMGPRSPAEADDIIMALQTGRKQFAKDVSSGTLGTLTGKERVVPAAKYRAQGREYRELLRDMKRWKADAQKRWWHQSGGEVG